MSTATLLSSLVGIGAGSIATLGGMWAALRLRRAEEARESAELLLIEAVLRKVGESDSAGRTMSLELGLSKSDASELTETLRRDLAAIPVVPGDDS